jgi:lincosamide nucleotidyltransferase A/C/D/E
LRSTRQRRSPFSRRVASGAPQPRPAPSAILNRIARQRAPASTRLVEFGDNPSVRLGSVCEVLDVLEQAGCRFWVAGGWGVDALVGRETREHRDLDVAIDADDEALALETLRGLGYEVETDWRPVRVELGAAGSRWVDLHPVRFDGHGNGRQASLDGGFFEYPSGCFVTGRIAERAVPSLSVDQQLLFRTGYALRDVDRPDIELLTAWLHASDLLVA